MLSAHSMDDTRVSYQKLVRGRKLCRACSGMTNPSAVESPKDSDRIGPYSRWQGNLSSELLVVGQDFSDVETYKAGNGWPGEGVGTNQTLVVLLREAGIVINGPRAGVSEDRLFFTNAVLCLKDGHKGSRVSPKCFATCGQNFLKPLIEIIRPKAVATLGVVALDAILRAYAMPRTTGLIRLLDQGWSCDLPGGTRLFPMAHPSRIVQARSRPLAKQIGDWRRLRPFLCSGST